MTEIRDEFFHFTRDGVLFHCHYEVKKGRFGYHSFKRPGSDQVCECPERESDRRALRGIAEVKT